MECFAANSAPRLLPVMTFVNIREVVKAAVSESCAASASASASANAKVSADHCLKQVVCSMAAAN